MKNSKLIKLLQQFSKNEMVELKTFIESPFFNKNKNIQQLMTFISLHAPCYETENFSYEQAFSYVFGKANYKKETIIKLFSKLLNLVEQYIVHSKIKKDQHLGKIELLKFYNKQHLTGYFESTIKKIRKLQNATPVKNDNWIYQQLLVEHEYAFFLSAHFDNGTGDVNLQATNDVLDIFYLQRKLRYFCSMKNRQRSVSFDFKYSLEKELNGFFQNSDLYEEPTIVIWRDAYLLLCDQYSLPRYLQLKSTLKKYADKISIADQRTLYTYLENTAKFVFTDFFPELFSLYEIQINQKVIYRDDFLVPVVFKNIVTVALRLKKFDWAAHFIKSHQSRLFPEHKEKEDIYFLCLAMLHFEKKDFDEALSVLNQAKTNNLYIKLEERRLRLKIYFEMEYRLLFEDNINSFRKFLSDHRLQIARYYLEANRSFINVIYSLYKTTNYEKKRQEKLKEMIGKMKVLPEEIWIREKLKKVTH